MKKILYIFQILLLTTLFSCINEDHEDDGRLIEGDDFTLPEIYHTHSELDLFLQQTYASYPEITSRITIGNSVDGRPIYAMIISDNPTANENNEPRIRLSGSIHGNEYISGEILIYLIEYITSNYGSDFTITDLVDNRYIVFIPMINPDGVAAGSRYNSNNVDLNRNFDSHWTSALNHGDSPFSEPESQAMRDYSLQKVFHLSATYHSGAVIVNMPFDYGKESEGIIPDEYDFVKYMAKKYSTATGEAPDFLDDPDLMYSSNVDQGTINGGDWYVINGSLQDWSYLETGCLDLTIEVADTSPQTAEGINDVFLYNRDSMISYIDAAGTGIYGRVTYDGNIPFNGAKIYIDAASSSGDLVTKTDSDGFYFKILEPGTYTINFSADGYTTQSLSNIVVTSGTSTQQNIQLN